MSWTLTLLIVFLLWLLALLIAVARFLMVVCRGRERRRQNQASSLDWKRRGGCLPIPDDIYRRPDPCIYSQYYLMSQGFAVTWNNPDIWLQRNQMTVPSTSLEPDTLYELVARVWNNSIEAPAVGLPVRFSYIDFGIGGAPQPIGVKSVDLPVKGANGHPAYARIPWKTPSTPGHYCILAQLIWPDDANPLNNLGQENTDVKPLNSPHALFAIPVRNDGRVARTLRLEADFYERPAAVPCPEQPARQPALSKGEIAVNRRAALARHGREHFRVPADWRVEVQPGQLRLDPGEEGNVAVDITTPDGFAGRQAININAFDGDRLAGGVTVYVE
jgi:hypothetical protein